MPAKTAVAVLLALALSGCTWFGPENTERAILQFEKGVTTESEVAARLGQPNVTTWMPDGTVVDVYTFVPAAGSPKRGTTARSRVMTIIFDRAGKLLSYSSTGS
jgi:hypothetical protein